MPVSDSHVHQSSPAEPVIQNSTSDIGEEGLSHESGETKSVYVKNLPLTATTLDILQEFQNFGNIKKDGVFLRQKKEIGICFAFVEFEDAQSVGNAVKASPIQLAGRQVYIEERRPTPPGASRGGGRGRGRGGRFGGRGYGESNRYGSNGFRNE
ncbi:RNA metabolism protein [Lithospermum erythrorhizon]|uniref:RNA metabolism protein n=1 Tax=Lithospermum erythrorhizon TaxID=34254 RepID=A0AAV3Q8X6_LITER